MITGSAGLIGSQAVSFFTQKGFRVFGVDNDMRRYYFGKDSSTSWNIKRLKETFSTYRHFNIDIRDEKRMKEVFLRHRFDLIVHAAAQPSHDWAVREPLTDFNVNAGATLALLENFRKHCPEAVFVFTSTNKVYGDRPNRLPFKELKTRYELAKSHPLYKGIDESMSIDQSLHSLFGASKIAADIFVQEYGRYFGLKTVSLRAGCLTGSLHSATELHGFLAYLGKCISTGRKYKIYGYKGKQVRDNMHSYDFVNAIYHFYLKPKIGEVYNIGGGRLANISVLEAIKKFEEKLKKKCKYEYTHKNRIGDHIWYISDISKFKKDYPGWDLRYGIDEIVDEIVCRGCL